MHNTNKNSSFVAIITLSVFFTYFYTASSLADETQALECLMEQEPQMQFVVCRSYSDRLAAKNEFTNEYSFLMMNVITNQIRKIDGEKDKSKDLVKATLVAMFDLIREKDSKFLQTSFDYAAKLGPAAEKKFDAGMQFLTRVMRYN